MSPISYAELISLHDQCIKALTAAPSTLQEQPACQNTELDANLFQKYAKYRAKLKDRVDFLESGNRQHEIPSEVGADLRMPRLLRCWHGMRSSPQGPESYIADGEGTCKFDAARIAQYRAFETEDFGKAMRMPGPNSLDKLAKLLVLEIAYANARHTDWVATAEAQWAHLGKGSAGDDDDAPAASVFDFVNEWSVTEPHKVLWKDLKLSVEPPLNFLKVGQTPVYMLPALLIARHVCSESTMTPADPDMLAYYEECASQYRRIFDAEIEEFMGTDARNYKNLMQRDFTNEEMEYITELRKLCREGGEGASAPAVESPAKTATPRPPPAVAKTTRGAAAAAAGRCGGGGGGGASAAAAAQRRQRGGGGGGATAAPAASAADEDESEGQFFSEGDSAFIVELERLSAVERAAAAAAAAGRGGGGGAAVAAAETVLRAAAAETAASGTVLRAASLRNTPRAAQAGAGGASAGAGAASAAPPPGLPPRGGGGRGRPAPGGRGIRTKRQAAVLAPGERILSKRGHPESTIAADGSLEDVLELPRNPVNNRVMPTAVHLNSAFPKNYAAAHPLKEPPVQLTIGQAYHAVSKTSAGRPRGGWVGLGGVDCGKGRFYPIPLNTTKCHIPVNTT